MRASYRVSSLFTAVVALILISLPANAAPAWRIDDKRGDAKHGIDIRRTTLDAQKSGAFRVRIFGYEFLRETLNLATVYFDTRKANAGPEFMLTWGLPGDDVWADPDDPNYDGDDFKAKLVKVDSWESEIRFVPCSGIRLARNLNTDVVTMVVPKRCLGRPNHLRWNVETGKVILSQSDEDGYSYYLDASPAFHRFQPRWVG